MRISIRGKLRGGSLPIKTISLIRLMMVSALAQVAPAVGHGTTCLTTGQADPLLNTVEPAPQPFDLSAFWVDSAVNGEGVAVTYYAGQ